MLLLQTARKPPRSQGRVGLAIAGGGPIGGMYELGALRALDEAIEGLDLTRLEVYVGVSSGAFLAAGLANRLDTAEMYRIFITGDSHEAKFRPEIFLQPAFLEYLQRASNLPRLAFDWWRDVLTDPTGSRLSDVVSRFGGLIPTGIFDNAEIERFLRDDFHQPRAQQRFPRAASARCTSSPSTSTTARPCDSAARAGTTCRSPAPCRPAPPCPACIRRWTSAGGISSTAHCAGPCMPRSCSTTAST